jgi:hypothetical protein
LGKSELAASMIPDLKRNFPEHAGEISELEQLRLQNDAKLAAIAMVLPGLSTGLHPDASTEWDGDVHLSYRHGGEYLDLPRDLALGTAIQGDAEAWWEFPESWFRFRGMHGFTVAAIARGYERRSHEYIPTSGARIPSLFGQSEYEFAAERDSPGAGIARWAAWEELAALVGSSRLSLRLTDVLVDCANHPRRRWFRRDDCASEAVARSLHRLVNIRRGLGLSELDVPNGKRAFEALHKNFPQSEWTGRTRYWYR